MRRKKIYTRKLVPVWAICSMLLLGGCSSDDLDLITDYGNNDVTVALAEGTVQVDDSSMDGDSDSAILGHDLFGSGKFEWKDNFITDDGSVKVDIDVDFNRVDVKKLPVYEYTALNSSTIREEEIVKNLFGDTAEKRMEEKLSLEREDSYKLIQSLSGFLNIVNEREIATDFFNPELPCWIEKDRYYIHTYEGIYRNVSCQLIIGYNYDTGTAYISMYPKNPGSMIGHPEYENVEVSNLKQEFQGMAMMEKTENDSKKAMENQCRMSKEERIETVQAFMKDMLIMDTNKDMLSASDVGYIGEETAGAEQNELEFYEKRFDITNPDDPKALEVTEKNGYYISILNSFGGINSYAEAWNSYNQGGFYVNDDGVMGFNLIINECLGEKLNDNTPVLGFEDLKECFQKELSADIYEDIVKRDVVYIKDMEILYRRCPGENANQGTMVPVLHMSAVEGAINILDVYMSMIDGTIIEIRYCDN